MGSGDHFVYIYKDGTVSYSKVELGRLVGDRYEIISGVPDGAYVVTSGASKLTDGMAVKVVDDK
jgi:multidrug efflux pump subunit AcrA (membrane-fusion protein)